MHHTRQTLKLGTRKSLLAWTQSSWVAEQVQSLNPGVQVELVGIETQGDRIQDLPLRAVEGKEFFVAELDGALASGAVDFCVHSMKDLSLDRPSAFTIAAMPARVPAHDMLICHERVFEKIASEQTLLIGTSSPRRLENIPPFLSKALPQLQAKHAKTKFVEIRGNVNTRLSRLHIDALSPEAARSLDGVVLAAAGLIRLWQDKGSRRTLELLLQNCHWMLLPLSQSPGAPAQGVLAVECRQDDREVYDCLRKLHHGPTESMVNRERAQLRQWGGGCHQRFGAAALDIPLLGSVMWVKGVAGASFQSLDELHWSQPKALKGKHAFASNQWRVFEETDLGELGPPPSEQNWFISHSRALPVAWKAQAAQKKIWSAGVESWYRLAAQGLWVSGCADGLGFESLFAQIQNSFLAYPENQQWAYLTHKHAHQYKDYDSLGARVYVSYELKPKELDQAQQSQVRQAQLIYWSSASQYDYFKPLISPGVRHCCGPGATATYLISQGLDPLIFPSQKEWSLWLQN